MWGRARVCVLACLHVPACVHACVCLNMRMYCMMQRGYYPALTVSSGTSADIFGGSSGKYICLNQSNWNAIVPYGELCSQLINRYLERYRAIFV